MKGICGYKIISHRMNISSYKVEDPENSKKVNVNELIALKKSS